MNPEDKELADAIFYSQFDDDAFSFAIRYLTDLIILHSVNKQAAVQAVLEIAIQMENDIEHLYDKPTLH